MMNDNEILRFKGEILSRLDKIEKMLEAQFQFNGKQMLDNRDLRLLLRVCDRTLIRWRQSNKLLSFKICGRVYYKASDVHKFIHSEYYLNGIPEPTEEKNHEKE